MSEAICKNCRHLRETTVEEGKEHYMACGWQLPALPNVMLATSLRHDAECEARRWITRTILNEMGHLLSECPTFEAKDHPMTPTLSEEIMLTSSPASPPTVARVEDDTQSQGGAEERTICEPCQGNGEIVTDWDRYLHAHEGDKGDEAVAECPDCAGRGYHSSQSAPSQSRGEEGALKNFAREMIEGAWDGCDGGDFIQEAAEKHGLIVRVPFNPDIHSGPFDDYVEPGDDWFVLSPLFRVSDEQPQAERDEARTELAKWAELARQHQSDGQGHWTRAESLTARVKELEAALEETTTLLEEICEPRKVDMSISSAAIWARSIETVRRARALKESTHG